MNAVIDKPTKLDIANSFSKAAVSYDQSAELQRRIGNKLLQKLPKFTQVNSIVDLGCGTGYFTKQLANQFPNSLLVGLDLAEGMLQCAKICGGHSKWLVGDAEQLPFKNNSIDVIFSNLALQWCHDFSTVLTEVYRVLKPQGVFLFTTLCDGTLTELKQSWQVVDNHQHINHFTCLQEYLSLLTISNLVIEDYQCVVEKAYYPTLKLLMNDLKGIGAHNINPQRHKGLTTRQQLHTLISAYEQFRDSHGLPASYQVLYGHLSKR